MVVHRAETREVVSSRLRPDTQGLKITEEKTAAVFSDKDDKPEGPSHNSLNVDNSVGR